MKQDLFSLDARLEVCMVMMIHVTVLGCDTMQWCGRMPVFCLNLLLLF